MSSYNRDLHPNFYQERNRDREKDTHTKITHKHFKVLGQTRQRGESADTQRLTVVPLTQYIIPSAHPVTHKISTRVYSSILDSLFNARIYHHSRAYIDLLASTQNFVTVNSNYLAENKLRCAHPLTSPVGALIACTCLHFTAHTTSRLQNVRHLTTSKCS